MPSFSQPPTGLLALEAQLARDLDLLNRPPPSWTGLVIAPDGNPLRDVLIVGAGLFGLAAAAALIFRGIRNVELLDRAAQGREGIWTTTARMPHLRSPKRLPALAMGMPNLSFRAWYAAIHGEAAWEALYKVPTDAFQDYLDWFRHVLALPVRNEVTVGPIHPRGGFLEAETTAGSVFARHIVLATGGRGSTATAVIPDGIARSLWPGRAAHTGEPIDFARLRGKRVAIMGASASAWDNAHAALSAGAAWVDMYVRRPALRQVNPWAAYLGNPGLTEGWPSLSLADRWALSLLLLRDKATTPPHESVRRVIAYENFSAHLASPILAAEPKGDDILLRIGSIPVRTSSADFLILGTGFDLNPARAPELAPFLPYIARWSDRYVPPPELTWPTLGRAAFLGGGFELTERQPGTCPDAARLRLFNYCAFPSLGMLGTEIGGASLGADRLAASILAALAREDIAHLRTVVDRYDQQELADTPFHAPEPVTAVQIGRTST